MTLFRILLALMFVAISGYTAVVVAHHGLDLFSVFIGDMAKLMWPGQFNLDFTCLLLLSGLWVSYRHRFRPLGLLLGLGATAWATWGNSSEKANDQAARSTEASTQEIITSPDKQNAKLEHDKALNRVVLELLSDHTELFKQFSDNPNFKRWLTDTVFDATYHPGTMPPKTPPQPGAST